MNTGTRYTFGRKKRQENLLFLDIYPNASVAYSLDKLSINITNVVNVERDSDNQTLDFTSKEVKDGTLENWVGVGNNGYVKTWYDQSGFNGHLLFNSLTNLIVFNGSLLVQNGSPYIQYSDTSTHSDYSLFINYLIDGETNSIFSVFSNDIGSSILFSAENTNNVFLGVMQDGNTSDTELSAGNINYYKNGSIISPKNRNTLFDNYVTSQDVLSTCLNVDFKNFNWREKQKFPFSYSQTSFTTNIKAKEFIVFSDDKSNVKADIENNRNAYYNIY